MEQIKEDQKFTPDVLPSQRMRVSVVEGPEQAVKASEGDSIDPSHSDKAGGNGW